MLLQVTHHRLLLREPIDALPPPRRGLDHRRIAADRTVLVAAQRAEDSDDHGDDNRHQNPLVHDILKLCRRRLSQLPQLVRYIVDPDETKMTGKQRFRGG